MKLLAKDNWPPMDPPEIQEDLSEIPLAAGKLEFTQNSPPIQYASITTVLVQFQCQAQGDIFYKQGQPHFARALVEYCPVCGNPGSAATGRIFPPVDETQWDATGQDTNPERQEQP